MNLVNGRDWLTCCFFSHNEHRLKWEEGTGSPAGAHLSPKESAAHCWVSTRQTVQTFQQMLPHILLEFFQVEKNGKQSSVSSWHSEDTSECQATPAHPVYDLWPPDWGTLFHSWRVNPAVKGKPTRLMWLLDESQSGEGERWDASLMQTETNLLEVQPGDKRVQN